MRCVPARLLLILAVFCVSSVSLAQTRNANPQAPLKVATRLVSPFILEENGKLTGFSVELWNALVRETGHKFKFVTKETLPELFDEVKSGRADMAIAAISITAERERIFDFSQPMLNGGLQIMVPTDSGQNASTLPALLALLNSTAFHELLILLGILILLPLPFIWLAERKDRHALVKARSLPGEAFKSIWWSASTLAGQATHMPYTFLGRVLAVIWMFVGVVFISYFTATVTANLTVKQLVSGISGPQDLGGKKVATVKGSTAAAYLRQNNIDIIELTQIEAAYAALKANQAAAIVYDAPILQNYAAKEGKGSVQLVGSIFHPEAYGILFPAGSPLRKPVNEALLKLRESGEYRVIYQRWFSTDASGG